MRGWKSEGLHVIELLSLLVQVGSHLLASSQVRKFDDGWHNALAAGAAASQISRALLDVTNQSAQLGPESAAAQLTDLADMSGRRTAGNAKKSQHPTHDAHKHRTVRKFTVRLQTPISAHNEAA